MLRIIIATILLSFCCVYGTQVWAPGVSKDSGWYDYNKTGENSTLGDTDYGMCWAVSASNVIAWWQQQNAETVSTLPNERPAPQDDQIWMTFRSVFIDTGATGTAPYDWYINGTGELLADNDNDGLVDAFDYDIIDNKDKALYTTLGLPGPVSGLASGNFLSSVYDTNIYSIRKANATTAANPYVFMADIVDAIKDGYALTLSAYDNGSHAYTIWGVEYTETTEGCNITKAWITDSDDGINSGMTDPTLLEKEVELTISEGKGWGVHFSDNGALNWRYVDGMRSAPLLIPEPGTAVLSLLALAGIAARRRHR